MPYDFYSYGICIRQEEGYCCIQYSPCADANSYTLDASQAAGDGAMQDTLCTADWVGIAGMIFISVRPFAVNFY